MLHRFLFFFATAALLALTAHRAQAQDVCVLCDTQVVVPPKATDAIVQKMWAPLYTQLRDSFSFAKSQNLAVLGVLKQIEQANTLPPKKQTSAELRRLADEITKGFQYRGYDADTLRGKFNRVLHTFKRKDRLTAYYAQQYALACAFACFAHETYMARPDHPDVPKEQRARYGQIASTTTTTLTTSAENTPTLPDPDLSFYLLVGVAAALAALCIYLLRQLQNATEKIKKLEGLLNPKPDVVPPAPPPLPTPPLPGSRENPLPPPPPKQPGSDRIGWQQPDSPPSQKPSKQSLTLYTSHPNGGIFYSVSPQFDHNLYMFRIVLPSPDAKEAELMLMDDSDVLRRTFSDLHTNLQSVAELYGVGQPSASIPYTVKPGRVVRHGENWHLKSKMELTW